MINKYETTLAKLRRKAKSQYRVTNDMIMNAAKLKGKMTVRCVTDKVKAEKGTRFYPARKKLDRTVEEEAKRSAQAETWGRRPASFWTEEIHGYIDNKCFAVPVTPEKKAILQKQKVHGHTLGCFVQL